MLAASLIYVLLQPALLVLQAVAALFATFGLQQVAAAGLGSRLASLGPGDPVYKSVVLWTLTGVVPDGLAVSEPLGGWLHAQWSGVFASPALLPAGDWAAAVVADGGTLLAELVARVVGYSALLLVGAALLWASRRVRGRWLLWLGAAILAQGVVSLVRVVAELSPHDWEILGVVHVLSKGLRWTPADYGMHQAVLPLALSVGVLAGLLVVGAIALCCWPGAARRGGWSRLRRVFGADARPRTAGRALVAAWLMALLCLHARWSAADELVVEAPAAAAPTAASEPADEAPEIAGSTVVAIQGQAYRYTYTVNGQRQVLRGIGYNVPYASRSRAWRAQRYDRDFGMMRAAGFNTLIGWDEREFDDLTLDKAQQYGLGVVWPYELPADGDYTDPAYCAEQRARVIELIKRYASHPALRMWGLGNEVFHDMPEQGRPERAPAFAEFYANLIDEAHALDPNHPVVYRDSEDVWFEPLEQALIAHGLEEPWVVYGANIFTPRVSELIRDWPERGLRIPLLISEYGPTGYAPTDRPAALVSMWDMIRQGRDYVLGGSIYAWTTEGIEAIDRVYGLVDDDGEPVDGALAAIGRRFATVTRRPCELAACAASGPPAERMGSAH